MTTNGKGVVVLGATSAIAKAAARAFASHGYDVVLAARDTEENELLARDLHVRYGVHAHSIAWEALDFDHHDAVYQACVDALGDDLSGVVLCSGTMDDQRAAERDWTRARALLDGNYTASVSILDRFANHLEERKAGFIAVVSSVAGDRGRQSNYLYGSAKAGLSTYLQGLRNRLHKTGVSVTTIKPGFVDTKMTWGMPGLFLVATPDRVGRSIYRAIRRRRAVAYIPWFWRYIMLIIRTIPEPIFKRMSM